MANFFNSKEFKDIEKTLLKAIKKNPSEVKGNQKSNTAKIPLTRQHPKENLGLASNRNGHTSQNARSSSSHHRKPDAENIPGKGHQTTTYSRGKGIDSNFQRLPLSNGNQLPVPLECNQRRPVDVSAANPRSNSAFQRVPTSNENPLQGPIEYSQSHHGDVSSSVGSDSVFPRQPFSNRNPLPIPLECNQRRPMDVNAADPRNNSVFQREIWKRDETGFLAPPRLPVHRAPPADDVRRDRVDKSFWNEIEKLDSIDNAESKFLLMESKQYVSRIGKFNRIVDMTHRNNASDVRSVLEGSAFGSGFVGQNKHAMQNEMSCFLRYPAWNEEPSRFIGDRSIRGMNMSRMDQLPVPLHRTVFVLKNWTVSKEDRKCNIRLTGTLIDRNLRNILSRRYKTGIVTGRYGPSSVRTQDYDYILEGRFIDPGRRIPPEIRYHFQNGFPSRWKEICENWNYISRSYGTSNRKLVVDLGARLDFKRGNAHQSDESSNGIEPFEESFTSSARSEPLDEVTIKRRNRVVEERKREAIRYNEKQDKRKRSYNFSDSDEENETEGGTSRDQAQRSKRRGTRYIEEEPLSKRRLHDFSGEGTERVIIQETAQEIRTPVGRGQLRMTLRSHSIKCRNGYKKSTSIVEKVKHHRVNSTRYQKTPFRRHLSPETTPKSARRIITRNHSWNRTKDFERSYNASPY